MGINKLLNSIGNKVLNYVSDVSANYQDMERIIANSKIFNLDKEIILRDEYQIEGNYYEYLKMCPYINLDYARKIDSLIPNNEYVLKIIDIVQKKDRQEYLLVLTDKRIIVVDKDRYTEYSYDMIKTFSLIKKGLMTQLVEFNGHIIDINVEYDELNIIYNIVTNANKYRDYVINEAKKYLCGIVPVFQRINKLSSGISISKDDIIVFHVRKESNYKCTYDDILNYELMEDTTVVLEKKQKEQSQVIKNAKKECYRMTFRVMLKNGKVFEVPIMDANTFGSSYSHSDKEYLKYYNFAKEIFDKLETYNPNIIDFKK